MWVHQAGPLQTKEQSVASTEQSVNQPCELNSCTQTLAGDQSYTNASSAVTEHLSGNRQAAERHQDTHHLTGSTTVQRDPDAAQLQSTCTSWSQRNHFHDLPRDKGVLRQCKSAQVIMHNSAKKHVIQKGHFAAFLDAEKQQQLADLRSGRVSTCSLAVCVSAYDVEFRRSGTVVLAG
jgi:hypothetical protein